MSCPFCGGEGEILGNELAFARYDAFPVSPGHLLVMPRRHVADWFDLTDDEQEAIFSLIREGKALLDAEFSPDGYNIGMGRYFSAQCIWHFRAGTKPKNIIKQD